MPCPGARGSPDPCHAGDPTPWPWWCRRDLRARRPGRGCPVPRRCQAPRASPEPRTPDRRPEDEAASSSSAYDTSRRWSIASSPTRAEWFYAITVLGVGGSRTQQTSLLRCIRMRDARCEPPHDRFESSARSHTFARPSEIEESRKYLILLVGGAGFEPAIPSL